MKTARAGKWNDVYNVSGEVKPNASSSAILKNLENKSQLFLRDNIIILAVGSNDKNPYELFTSLCNILSKLKNNRVYLLGVQRNNYLNTKLLNSELKMIAKITQIANTYVETNLNIHHNYYYMNPLDYLSFKLIT